jgi:N-formylglutamate deformylase
LLKIAPGRWSACHLNLPLMNTTLLHGPRRPTFRSCWIRRTPARPFPADFDAIVSEFDLRDGEDCFVDELYLPATELGVPLLAAQFPRTYIDPNRHAGDIDLDLIEAAPGRTSTPSGKARDRQGADLAHAG